MRKFNLNQSPGQTSREGIGFKRAQQARPLKSALKKPRRPPPKPKPKKEYKSVQNGKFKKMMRVRFGKSKRYGLIKGINEDGTLQIKWDSGTKSKAHTGENVNIAEKEAPPKQSTRKPSASSKSKPSREKLIEMLKRKATGHSSNNKKSILKKSRSSRKETSPPGLDPRIDTRTNPMMSANPMMAMMQKIMGMQQARRADPRPSSSSSSRNVEDNPPVPSRPRVHSYQDPLDAADLDYEDADDEMDDVADGGEAVYFS